MHFFFFFFFSWLVHFLLLLAIVREFTQKWMRKWNWKAVNWYFNCTDTGFEIPAANQSYNIYREKSNRDISSQAFNWNPNEITLWRCGMPEACTWWWRRWLCISIHKENSLWHGLGTVYSELPRCGKSKLCHSKSRKLSFPVYLSRLSQQWLEKEGFLQEAAVATGKTWWLLWDVMGLFGFHSCLPLGNQAPSSTK